MFSCIKICQVLIEMLKAEVKACGFKPLQSDKANVNVIKIKFDCYYCIN